MTLQLRTTSLTWQVIGDELVVLDLEGSVYLTLNGTARLIWEHVVEGCDEAQLTDAVLATYDVEPATACADVAVFVEELRSRGLLEGR